MNRIASTLIVDDNRGDLDFCRIVLSRAGCFGPTLMARTGEEALEMFRDYDASRLKHPDAFPPSLILLDVNMPRMDGFEFLEAYEPIRTARPETEAATVVMLTSSEHDADRKRAEAFSSVKDFLVKPLRKADALKLAARFGQP